MDDAISPHSQVAAVTQQLHVGEHHHEAQRQVHAEGREAEAEDGLHDAGLQAEASPAEAHVAPPPQEVPQHPGRPHGVGHVRGPGRPRDAPAEAEDEQRVEHHVDQRADNHGPHGLARVARGPHDAVEAVAQRREAGKGDDDAHVFLGIADGAFRAAEEGEDVVHERERQPDGRAGDDECEDERMGQDAFRLGVVALAQGDGNAGRRAVAHQHAERGEHVHERKGQRQPRQRQRSHTLPDKDAVHDVEQRHHHRARDGRQGVMPDELADALGSQLPMYVG